MFTILAPAKINLVLEVGQRRPDGFHELATVFQSIALYDHITISAETGADIELEVTGPQAQVGGLGGQANLVWRAARLFAAATHREKASVRIRLEKNIPVAAGLGGGSSDAAATLRGLAYLWNVTNDDLVFQLATQLGSDVAFFLYGGAALGKGRGELLTPVALPQFWFTLVNPGIPSSTAEVYRELAARRAAGKSSVPVSLGARCQALINGLTAGNGGNIGAWLANDLAEPAVCVTPAIRPLLTALQSAGAVASGISGSGSTVFAVANDAGHAERLARQVASLATWTWWGPSIMGGDDYRERSTCTN